MNDFDDMIERTDKLHLTLETMRQAQVNRTYHRDGKVSVLRNDPCPCGSGKKFKKCCRRKIHG